MFIYICGNNDERYGKSLIITALFVFIHQNRHCLLYRIKYYHQLKLNMENSIENRINRSLINHNLDNLVFEKRSRKTIQPAFPIPIHVPDKTKKHAQPKKATKTDSKKAEAQSQKRTSLLKQKAIVKKNREQEGLKPKVKKQRHISESEEQVIEEQINSSSSSEFIQKKQKQRKGTKNVEPIKTNAKSQQKITKITEKGSLERIQLTECKEPNTLVHRDKEFKIKQEERFSESESDQRNRQEKSSRQGQPLKRKRGRPKKPIEPSQTALKQEQSPEIDNKQQPIKANQVPQKPVSIQKNNEAAQIFKHEPAQLVDIPEITEFDKMAATRSRRAKFNSMIKYTQNDEQMNSEQSFQTEKDLKKRKKIFKAYRNKNRPNQPYHLNRIFRKEAKRNFSSFEVNVDLNKLALQSFVKEFGVFDLIHFSLPLQFLHMFPQASVLIEKGFIFVWAQQRQTQLGYHLLNRWGFDVIDQIIWIKSNIQEGKVEADNVNPVRFISDSSEDTEKTKDLFINIKSTCLVGYKCPLGNKAQYRTKVSNNIIFAQTLRGCKKPAQIYEIADLMMPGGKKLQFGGAAQKGWLNLRHHEKTLNRCHSCFKQENLYLLPDQEKQIVKCKKCIVDELPSEKQAEPDLSTLQKKFKEVKKMKIARIQYIDSTIQMNCPRCGKGKEQLEFQNLLQQIDSNEQMCLKCFKIKSIDLSVDRSVQIKSRKKYFYNSASFSCSNCHSQAVHDVYFQCTKSKNRKICKACFWKTGELTSEGGIDSEKKQTIKNVNEWKLRFVKNNPWMKFSCFGCKSDLSIPFWTCETCQSWAWCGNCDKGSSETHPHYQTDKHKQYLMI